MDTSGKTSGWVNLNGLLIQWGIADNGVETTEFVKYVTFSKPYTNNNYSCLAYDFRVENNGSDRHSYTSIYNKQPTGMTVGHYLNNYRYISWMTIGHA